MKKRFNRITRTGGMKSISRIKRIEKRMGINSGERTIIIHPEPTAPAGKASKGFCVSFFKERKTEPMEYKIEWELKDGKLNWKAKDYHAKGNARPVKVCPLRGIEGGCQGIRCTLDAEDMKL